MERKTRIDAQDGQQDLVITREFDLPVDLLFRAHSEPEIIEQWMGNKVLKFEAKKHGDWQFQVKGPEGKIMFQASGVFHEFIPEQKIIRTFEMENASLPVQLEFLEFEALTDDTSKLTMHIIYKSNAYRDQMMQMGFAPGINMAHNRLQEEAKKASRA